MDRLKLGRLLIVDDESELVAVLCETLEAQGYETEGFTKGQKALQKLKKEEFDLLLTDLMMPEMDGIALLKAALAINPDLIGIIMTGQGTVQTAVEAMKIGAFDYILKPFKLNTLLPIISRAMGVRNLKKENIELRATLAIYELTKIITLTTDLQVIANKVADAAMEQTQADEVSIMLPIQDSEDDELYVAAVRGSGRNHILGQRIKAGQSIAGWVARHHELIQLEGEVTDPRFKPISPRPEIKTAVSIPMMAGGKFVGVLNLNAVSRRTFTIGQIKALTITISMAAPSIENARLFEMLRAAEAKYRNIFENASEGIFQVTPEGRFITANPSLVKILGCDSLEELMVHITDMQLQLYVDGDQHLLLMKELEKSDRIIGFETQVYRRDGAIAWVSMNSRTVRNNDGRILYYEGSIEDITHRKQAEARQILFIKALDLLNQATKKGDLIRKILYLLKEETEIEAVGIRLREGEDFPYFETKGFSEDFVEAERVLCARDQDGRIIRDAQGNTYLECMCGNIICGRTNPSLPFFTEDGSFWTNNTTKLLASTSEEDRQGRTRNRCNGEGYESVALIPLRSGDEIIGLLQLNDKKPDRFSLDRIKFFEGIGASIGIALARKQAEEALGESEKKYRELYDFLPIPVYEMDLETNITSVNRSIYETFRGTEEDLKKGLKAWQLLSPEEVEKSAKNIQRLLKGEQVEGTEYTLMRLDGSVFPAIVISSVIYSDGKPVGLRGAIVDITERKQAEESLLKGEEKFRTIFDGASDGILIADAITKKFLQGNTAICSMLGYTNEEIKSLTIYDIHPPKDISHVIDEFEKQAKGEKVLAEDLPVLRKDGSIFYADISSVFTTIEGIHCLVGIFRDNTERKRAEEELHRTLESLRKAVSATIQVLVSAVESRDPYTAGHQLRSAGLARAIATEMGLPQGKIDGIQMAGSIHDIGKLSIPAEILSKPTKLTDIEFSLIKEHSQKGYEMLKDVESSLPLAEIIYQHHERMDGSGYPRNLKGDEILMEARILAVSDVVEAMASHRPYRPALGIEKALEEISQNRDVLYDPEAVDACLRLFKEKGFGFE